MYATRSVFSRLQLLNVTMSSRGFHGMVIQVAILVDDMIDTGATLALAARSLADNGARKVYAIVSHGLLSETNMKMIEELPIEQLVVRPASASLIYGGRGGTRCRFVVLTYCLTQCSPGYEYCSSKAARSCVLEAGDNRREPYDCGEYTSHAQRREYISPLR